MKKKAAIRIKRTYDAAESKDGRRVLVERLWPRGMTKQAVAADEWLKDVAPSTELRKWYGHQVERWPEFVERYRAELEEHPEVWAPLARQAEEGHLTLLFSAHDADHNSAVVLRDFLLEHPHPA